MVASAAAMAAFRSLMASMDEDTRDFISSMEHKAKKILEKSNQRRVADSQRQLQDAVQETRRQRKARKNGGKGSPPPEKTWDWMGQDGGGTATLADDGGGGGGGGGSGGSSASTAMTQQSRPSSSTSAGAPPSSSTISLVPLHSLDERAIEKRRNRLAGSSGNGSGKGGGSSLPLTASLRERLQNSPLAQLQAKSLNPAANLANNHRLGAQNLTTGGATHTFRPDHAVDARMSVARWTNPDAKTGLEAGLRSLPRIKAMGKDVQIKVDPLEPQGPTNWASDDLRFKYRDEHGRQIAHLASKRQVEEAERLEREQGIIVPAVRIAEHPNWVHLFEMWRDENKRASERERQRNRAKVFGLDVKALWRAHKPPKLPEARMFAVANSLQRRRDMEEIMAGQHQVQSVSATRAFENAVVSPLEQLTTSTMGAVKMVKKLRRKLDAHEQAAADGVELSEEEQKFFAPQSEHYEPWARLSRYHGARTVADWAGVRDADDGEALPDRRWLLVRLERSQNLVRARITDVAADGGGGRTWEIVESRRTVEWAMGGEFEANKAAAFADRLAPVLPPADLRAKPMLFNRLNPLQPPTSFFVSGHCAGINEVPGIGVLGAETCVVVCPCCSGS